MSKIKNFEEFLKEDVQPVQDKAIQPQSQSTFDSSKAKNRMDFVYLDKDGSIEKIKDLCENIKLPENRNFIMGVVIRPEFVSEMKKYLEDTDLKIISVISLPDGDEKISEKIRQTNKSISEGADEINVVMNYKKLMEIMSEDDEDKDSKLKDIQTDMRSLVEICKEKSVILKIIIEMEALNGDNILNTAIELCKNSNVDYITTSTGMYDRTTNYTFESKLKDVNDIIIPMIQGNDSINININGGVNSLDRLMECLKMNKIQRISTSILPVTLFKK